MSHEPKLTVYTITLKAGSSKVELSNRWLFRNKIGEANSTELEDSYILAEIFKLFIAEIDMPEMFSDSTSRKCMTANQVDIEDSSVNTNISFHSDRSIIEGKVEGGSYGRKRNKTSTLDKSIKTNVDERDAITDDFYFLLYMPLESNKLVLMLQSYSDDSIDSVMKKFWLNFFSFESIFQKPIIKRYVPNKIIEDFKKKSTVSSLSFTTEVPGETLHEGTHIRNERAYKVTVQITPIKEDFSLQEFEELIEPIQKTTFASSLRLGMFSKQKGQLKDNGTDKTSPFELGSSFEIQPTIVLSKYIDIKNDENDIERIRSYCFSLLETVKPEIYTQYAVQER